MSKRYKPNYSSDWEPSPSPPHDMMSDASYDEDGQPRWGGVGQGAPLDDNGRYIYSQIGQPVVPSPSPPPSGNVESPRDADHCDTTSTNITFASGNDVGVDRLRLKRKRLDSDHENSLPHTPQACRFGAMLTNTPSRATSVPIQLLHAPKRPHLQDPFDFRAGLQVSTRMENLEKAMTDLQQSLKVVLERQTELLSEILDAICRENPTS